VLVVRCIHAAVLRGEVPPFEGAVWFGAVVNGRALMIATVPSFNFVDKAGSSRIVVEKIPGSFASLSVKSGAVDYSQGPT
jgi:hypothetical protein